jgi:AAA domain/CHC2 zinc finger
MSRDEIISANSIADFVRDRGHELKRSGENFVTSACPVTQHKKYHRPVTIDIAKQVWHCNDCGVGGSVVDWLMQEKNITAADAMRELGGGRNDSEPPGKIVATYDYTDEHGKLLFQVCRFDPKTFKARRGPDDPQCKLGIKGVRRVLYRLPEVIKAQLVCITEGEKNADDLAALGFVATTNPFGAGKWHKEYNEFLRGKDVVVFGDVGDPDKAGEKHTEQVIASLASSDIAARHAQQPDGFHDVTNFIESLPTKEVKRAAIEKLIVDAKAAQSDLPAIEDAAGLISMPIILPATVIEGIAHRGEKVSVGGASKAFKTWILSDLAISVATGGLWLGHFPTTRGKVLHINFELLPAYFTQRLRTLADENQVTLEKDYLQVWNLRGFACDLAMLLPKILQRVGSVEYSLINLDPIYKLLGKLREENLAGDIADLLNQIESLAVKTGAAVCYGAHYSKGNQAQKESIDRVAGSGVYGRDPNSILNFTRHEQDNCFSVEITLRHHPPVEPCVVRWEYPLFTVDATLNPAQLKQTGRPQLYRAEDLLELIDRNIKTGEVLKLADDELGIDRRRTHELLADLKRSGRIKQPKRGEYEPA